MPGDLIGALPVNPCIHPAGLPINTSTIKVLRRPVESAVDPPIQLEAATWLDGWPARWVGERTAGMVGPGMRCRRPSTVDQSC